MTQWINTIFKKVTLQLITEKYKTETFGNFRMFTIMSMWDPYRAHIVQPVFSRNRKSENARYWWVHRACIHM